MPEGRITLSHAVVFMALSPKSNSVYKGIDGALDFVKRNPTLEVPGHISNVSPDKKNYQYPHSYPGNWVQQDYLPKNVKENFYVPSSNGSEKVLVEQWKNKSKNF
jgi:putative ATPase